MFESRVSVRNTPAAEWDRNTWPALLDLAENHPEAGIHFQGIKWLPSISGTNKLICQGTEIHNREKDLGSATATWFADLLSPNPWWRSLLPDVRVRIPCDYRADTRIVCSSRKYQSLSSKRVLTALQHSHRFVSTPQSICPG